ncbi:hypothetical protein HYDPIDRAFT_101822, partial [Hydnomerulius pinastri MD-312]
VNNIHHSVLCKVYKLEGYSGRQPVYRSMRDLGNASEVEDEGDEDNVIADAICLGECLDHIKL